MSSKTWFSKAGRTASPGHCLKCWNCHGHGDHGVWGLCKLVSQQEKNSWIIQVRDLKTPDLVAWHDRNMNQRQITQHWRRHGFSSVYAWRGLLLIFSSQMLWGQGALIQRPSKFILVWRCEQLTWFNGQLHGEKLEVFGRFHSAHRWFLGLAQAAPVAEADNVWGLRYGDIQAKFYLCFRRNMLFVLFQAIERNRSFWVCCIDQYWGLKEDWTRKWHSFQDLHLLLQLEVPLVRACRWMLEALSCFHGLDLPGTVQSV